MSVFSLGTLAAYIDQTQTDLIKKPVLQNKSSKLFTIQPGIKNAEALQLLDDTTYFGDGSQCGYTFSGSSALTQRVLTVGKIKVSKNYCLKDLETYWAGKMLLAVGSHQETFSAEEQFVEQATARIQEALEIATWQSSTVASASSPTLGRFDGFLRIIENASGSYVNATGSVAAGNLITGSITVSNVRQLIEQNVYGQIPITSIDNPGMAVYSGRDVFILYTRALANANLFNFYDKDNPDQTIIYGTSMPLIPVNGLNGTSKVVAIAKNNAFIGTDLANDYETVRSWYSPDNDEIRLSYDFKYGTQIAYPDQVTYAFIH